MKKQLKPGRVAVYLLALAAVCTLVWGVSYARYRTDVAGAAKGTAATMALGVVDGAQELNLSDRLSGMTPGETRTVSFTITNTKDGVASQVAQTYDIAIETTNNLPLTYSLAHQGSATAGGAFAAGEAGSLTWTGGRLPADAASHTYTLTVSWPAEKNGAWYMNEIDAVTLRVNAAQAQPQAGTGN